MKASQRDMAAMADIACTLCCLVECMLLLWLTKTASGLGGEPRGCKPRGVCEACAPRRAASNPRPRPTHRGQRSGLRRAALLLLLVAQLRAGAAAGTICSVMPTVCNGTFSGTTLCAPLAAPAVHHQRIGRQQGRFAGSLTGRTAGRVSVPAGVRRANAHVSRTKKSLNLSPALRASGRDLAGNSLTGTLPTQLGNLAALNWL